MSLTLPAVPAPESKRIRLVIVALVLLAAYLLLAVQLFNVTVLGESARVLRAQAQDNGLLLQRADIVDRNGTLLATNLITASLYANPKNILNPKEAAAGVHKILPEFSYNYLLKAFTSKKNFVWIKRSITPEEQHGINALGIPGLQFEREERRVYPYGNLLAHVLGYVGVDGKGLAGLEKAEDDALLHKAMLGEPLELSIDVRVQNALRDELQKHVQEFRAIGATGVVMDTKTGEVLAMVSLPDFDPHNPGSSAEARFNKATQGVYEVGSTFKTFTMAMALDSGIVNMAKVYDVAKPLRMASFAIRDFHHYKEKLSLPEIYMYSSNIGTARIAMDVGEEGQKAFLDRLGILKSIPIEVSERAAPLLPHAWKKINMLTISYGHGIAITPLHVVQGTAALVNGGILHTPTLLKRHGEIPEGERVISEETSEEMRKLMRLVVAKGTGSRAAAVGYMVGGKTGTAEKAAKGGYNRSAMLSSFVGAFPMHDPRYVVLAMLDEPKGAPSTFGFATGGMTAAPVVREVVNRIAPMLGVEPVDENDPELLERFHIDYEARGAEIAAN